MSFSRIMIGLSMVMRMLYRRQIVLILLVVIPFVFLTIVELTSSEIILPFRLASLDDHVFIQISAKGMSFIFFAIASAGFLMSFLALNLIQRNHEVNRRLILCGYHPIVLLLSHLLALLLMIVVIALYVGILTHLYFPVQHLFTFVISLVLIGFVYGCYGLAVGSLIKGELEGLLLIVLLVNIDAGWLQNPLFYAEAQNQIIIRYLPAYFPSQTGMIAAFTEYSTLSPSINSILYGSTFLLLAMIIFFYKMRTRA